MYYIFIFIIFIYYILYIYMLLLLFFMYIVLFECLHTFLCMLCCKLKCTLSGKPAIHEKVIYTML